MADISQIVLKDANGNVIGTYDVKDTSVPHTSESASSGGTTLSLVTTGEKATWNAKADTNTDKLVDLTDVNITTPLNAQPLVYDDNSGKYKLATNVSLYNSSNQTIRLNMIGSSVYVYKNSGTVSPGVSLSIEHQDTENANGKILVNNSNSSPAVQLYADDGGTNGGGMVNVFTNSGQSKIRLHGSNGNIETTSVTILGGDVTLGTSGSSDNDSGDIVWTYGNGQEKARLWTDNTYTSAKGLNYRLYKADGTQLTSGSIPLSNTNDAVTQTNTASTNANYRVLLSATNDDTTRTEGARKNGDLYYNPSTKNLHSTKFNNYVLADACSKGATSSITSGSASLITSGAVYTGLSGKQNTLSTVDVSSSLGVSGNFQSVTKKLFKYGNIIELFITANVKTAIADNAVIFTVPSGYNPKVNDSGFTFFTGTDPYVPTGFKFGYFTWGGRDFHTLGALPVGTQVTVHITYLL